MTTPSTRIRTRNGGVAFGFDEQARVDFGYHSYDLVTRAAKALIGTYYGKAAERSYFVGCSEGGREAMMMSQRFPDYFDGILACSPGFNLPKAALFGHSWDVQSLAGVAKAAGMYDRFGEPLLNKTFTDEDLDLASQAILGACDALDGLADGIIDNFAGCTTEVVAPKLAAVTCKGPKRNTASPRRKWLRCRNSMQGPEIPKVNCSIPIGPGTVGSAVRLANPTTRAGACGRWARMTHPQIPGSSKPWAARLHPACS